MSGEDQKRGNKKANKSYLRIPFDSELSKSGRDPNLSSLLQMFMYRPAAQVFILIKYIHRYLHPDKLLENTVKSRI